MTQQNKLSKLAPPIVIMGVSGSGKSTVGQELAARLRAVFVDGDDLHPESNKQKMASAIPLDDDDRAPWLQVVGETLRDGRAQVVACSALKRTYRDIIRSRAPTAFFVYLCGEPEVLAARLASRSHEYMPASLLRSQLDALEPLDHDEYGIAVDISLTPAGVIERVTSAITAADRG